MANQQTDDDLLTAYVDGVGELTPAERRAVEARLPELRADADATRDVLAALRALPAEGGEPAWPELAARISAEVGDRAPRAWWRGWLVPAAGGLALAACALVYLASRGAGELPRAGVPSAPPIEAAVVAPPSAAAPDAVYLDGEAVEIGELDRASLGALDDDDGDADVVGDALLPTPDLAWVDDLDPASLALAARWLDRKGT